MDRNSAEQTDISRIDLDRIDIKELLPQQPPFVMVDKLLAIDRVHTQTQLTVRPDNLFYEQEHLTASGLIENMAQTCAARMGFINKYVNRSQVKLGFIGAIRNLRVFRTPTAGEQLTTSIEVIEEVFQMTLVDARITVGAETLVSAGMKIALSDIDSQNQA
ncbi:MAG: pseudouridylate synthase [Prevotellaceae bacterium]|jgi:predicted hotdog family 3-hydroxylacyl-ACP dehydratase|nr:pseudouridylate synthase [Prevotellaceae bacterium]